jgi:hypothetical protein
MALRESKTIRLKRATVVPRPFRQILYTLLMPFDSLLLTTHAILRIYRKVNDRNHSYQTLHFFLLLDLHILSPNTKCNINYKKC